MIMNDKKLYRIYREEGCSCRAGVAVNAHVAAAPQCLCLYARTSTPSRTCRHVLPGNGIRWILYPIRLGPVTNSASCAKNDVAAEKIYVLSPTASPGPGSFARELDALVQIYGKPVRAFPIDEDQRRSGGSLLCGGERSWLNKAILKCPNGDEIAYRVTGERQQGRMALH